jgi:hypothetical protein
VRVSEGSIGCGGGASIRESVCLASIGRSISVFDRLQWEWQELYFHNIIIITSRVWKCMLVDGSFEFI